VQIDVLRPLLYIFLLRFMKAMLLAAGFGSRLFPLTIDRTKPAIPFLGRPLVGYVAEYLSRHGFDELMVNLHHQPESVMRALGDGSQYGVSISYSIEQPSILGTSGALAKVRDWLGNDDFLVVNGKIISEIDISAALRTHRSSGAVATMVLKPNSGRERFTEVFAKNAYITGFGGFPSRSENEPLISPPLMFTGIHILSPKIFDFVPSSGYSDIVPSFYSPALRSGLKIAAHITDESWYELSTIERYLQISLAVSGNSNVICGNGGEIGEGSSISSSVLWDDVSIESGGRISNCVIGDDVVIRADEEYHNCAIVRAEMVRRAGEIPEKARKGEFSGDKYVVPLEL
jgi:NDP-sugar pyrophosphorylase family protein